MKQEYQLPFFKPDDDRDSALIYLEVLEIFQDYHVHKDPKPLADAIRNRPELFQSEILRNWVADIVEEKYTPKKSGFVTKKKVIKNRQVCATVRYCQAMGFPVYYESTKKNKMNACQFASKIHSVAATTIYEMLGNEKRKNYGRTVFTGHGFEIHDGTIIWILNGFKSPESIAEIKELEKKLKSLPENDYKRIKKFSQGYDANKCKAPKTKQELEAIEKILNGRSDYQFIKTIQVKNPGL